MHEVVTLVFVNIRNKAMAEQETVATFDTIALKKLSMYALLGDKHKYMNRKIIAINANKILVLSSS